MNRGWSWVEGGPGRQHVCGVAHTAVLSGGHRCVHSSLTHPRELPGLSLALGDPVIYSISCVILFPAPWTVARQVPVHGIFQARILEWVAIFFSRGSSQHGY